MTCYFRHMKGVFTKAGLEVTSENRQEIDRIIHSIVNTEYEDCPATWKEVKKRISEDEDAFALKLKAAWKAHQLAHES